MKDKNQAYNELKYYMEHIEEEYDMWFPENAHRENCELLFRLLYQDNMNSQAVDILTRYNHYLYDIFK